MFSTSMQYSCVTFWQNFHPDHLGSSTFLSDETGQAYQFLLYLPWGDRLIPDVGRVDVQWTSK